MSEFASIHKRWAQIANDASASTGDNTNHNNASRSSNASVKMLDKSSKSKHKDKEDNKDVASSNDSKSSIRAKFGMVGAGTAGGGWSHGNRSSTTKASTTYSKMKLDIDEEDESFDGSQVMGIISPRGVMPQMAAQTQGTASANANSNPFGLSCATSSGSSGQDTTTNANNNSMNGTIQMQQQQPMPATTLVSPRNLNFNIMGQQNVASAKYELMFGTQNASSKSILSPRAPPAAASDAAGIHTLASPRPSQHSAAVPTSPTPISPHPHTSHHSMQSPVLQSAAVMDHAKQVVAAVGRKDSDLWADVDDNLDTQPRREDRQSSMEDTGVGREARHESLLSIGDLLIPLQPHKARSDVSALHQAPALSSLGSQHFPDEAVRGVASATDSRQASSLAYGTPSRPSKRLSTQSDHETPSNSQKGSKVGSPRAQLQPQPQHPHQHQQESATGGSGRVSNKQAPPSRAQSSSISLARGASVEAAAHEHGTHGSGHKPGGPHTEFVMSPRLISMQSNAKDGTPANHSGRLMLMHAVSPDPMEPVNDTESEGDDEQGNDSKMNSKSAGSIDPAFSLSDVLEPEHSYYQNEDESEAAEPSSQGHKNLRTILSGKAPPVLGSKHINIAKPEGGAPGTPSIAQGRMGSRINVKGPRTLKHEKSRAASQPPTSRAAEHAAAVANAKLPQHGGTSAIGDFSSHGSQIIAETPNEEEDSVMSPGKTAAVLKASGRLSGRLLPLSSLSTNEPSTPSTAAASAAAASGDGGDAKKKNAIKKFLGMSARK